MTNQKTKRHPWWFCRWLATDCLMVATIVGKRAAPSLQFVHCTAAAKHFKAESTSLGVHCRAVLVAGCHCPAAAAASHRLRKNKSCRIHYNWFPSSSSYSYFYIIVIILVIIITIVILLLLLLIIIRSHLLTLVVGEGQGFDRCSWKITIWAFMIIVKIYRSSLSSLNVDVMKTL